MYLCRRDCYLAIMPPIALIFSVIFLFVYFSILCVLMSRVVSETIN
jgi:hypothetical protein